MAPSSPYPRATVFVTFPPPTETPPHLVPPSLATFGPIPVPQHRQTDPSALNDTEGTANTDRQSRRHPKRGTTGTPPDADLWVRVAPLLREMTHSARAMVQKGLARFQAWCDALIKMDVPRSAYDKATHLLAHIDRNDWSSGVSLWMGMSSDGKPAKMTATLAEGTCGAAQVALAETEGEGAIAAKYVNHRVTKAGAGTCRMHRVRVYRPRRM